MDLPQLLADVGDRSYDRHVDADQPGLPHRKRPGVADLPTAPERSSRRAARGSW